MKKGLGPFCCGTREVHAGQLQPLSIGDRHPLLKLNLFGLYVNKSISLSSAWLYHVFFGDSNTKMQWAEVFESLFLMIGIAMIFAIFHVVGILSWHW